MKKEQKPDVASTLLQQLERRDLLMENNSAINNNYKLKSTRIDREFFSEVQRQKLGKIDFYIYQYMWIFHNLFLGTELAHIRPGFGQMRLTNSYDRTATKKHFNKNKREKLRRLYSAAVPTF